MEVFKKVKKEKRLLEEIETLIPGFRGYKKREIRRESDKLLRDYIARKLKEAKSYLKDCILAIAESDKTEFYNVLSRISAALDLATSKIEHADYGYSGFFDAVKIRSDDLERLLEYDSSLVKVADEIIALTKTARELATGRKFEELKTKLDDLKAVIDRFNELINQRENIIIGLR
ncbi:MAG: hypothetical protein DRJ37_03375 [Thermoprotei archaeon]|nr:MAG: hypothetical protein DRJ37_03375 [Thermoprotei archaeon]